MEIYKITNNFGQFMITHFNNGHFSVNGSIKAARHEFKKINRMPPNKYGNFYGRENSGFAACAEILKGENVELVQKI